MKLFSTTKKTNGDFTMHEETAKLLSRVAYFLFITGLDARGELDIEKNGTDFYFYRWKSMSEENREFWLMKAVAILEVIYGDQFEVAEEETELDT